MSSLAARVCVAITFLPGLVMHFACKPTHCLDLFDFSLLISIIYLHSLHTVPVVYSSSPRSGELRMQKLKSHLVRTQSLNVLPLKPGVGQYIAIRATLTATDFVLAYFYPSSPFICIFSKTSPDFFLCWLWLTLVPV